MHGRRRVPRIPRNIAHRASRPRQCSRIGRHAMLPRCRQPVALMNVQLLLRAHTAPRGGRRSRMPQPVRRLHSPSAKQRLTNVSEKTVLATPQAESRPASTTAASPPRSPPDRSATTIRRREDCHRRMCWPSLLLWEPFAPRSDTKECSGTRCNDLRPQDNPSSFSTSMPLLRLAVMTVGKDM